MNPSTAMVISSRPGGPLRGEALPPGDKSISHRALILGALAVGCSRFRGLLMGDDVLCTAQALQAMGVDIHLDRQEKSARVHGVGLGGLCCPSVVLDFGNSGTAVRLMMGVLAAHPFAATLTGDSSLCCRPMGRVVAPLQKMGATIEGREAPNRPEDLENPERKAAMMLPVMVKGGDPLMPIKHRLPVPSAQLKSALLLAGLHAEGTTTVIEPSLCRDHTERMLHAMGGAIVLDDYSQASEREQEAGTGRMVSVTGGTELSSLDMDVPIDFSSAAFPMVAATIVPGSEVLLPGVGCNPTRMGLLQTLIEMGGNIEVTNSRLVAGEPVADLRVKSGRLHGADVPLDRVPAMIDEFPILAVAAALAEGETRFRGVGELRVKESDRLQAVYDALCLLGVSCAMGEDWLTISGVSGATELLPSTPVEVASHFDHRIAMAFAVMGLICPGGVTVDQAEAVSTSFPGFVELMASLGGDVQMRTLS